MLRFFNQITRSETFQIACKATKIYCMYEILDQLLPKELSLLQPAILILFLATKRSAAVENNQAFSILFEVIDESINALCLNKFLNPVLPKGSYLKPALIAAFLTIKNIFYIENVINTANIQLPPRHNPV
jgi:hypothetical protein